MQPKKLLLAQLEAECRTQTERFLRGETSDSSFCLEIFRRALQHATVEPNENSSAPTYQDEAAREAIIRLYTPLIKTYINRRVLRGRSLEDLCQQVWSRFWQAANRGLDFPTLESALMYIKRATTSTLMEDVRTAIHEAREIQFPTRHEDDGETTLVDSSADPFEQQRKRQFWERCAELITDPIENRVFRLRYTTFFKPSEIAKLLNQESLLIHGKQPISRAVSDMLERIMKRLANDGQIQDLLGDD